MSVSLATYNPNASRGGRGGRGGGRGGGGRGGFGDRGGGRGEFRFGYCATELVLKSYTKVMAIMTKFCGKKRLRNFCAAD